MNTDETQIRTKLRDKENSVFKTNLCFIRVHLWLKKKLFASRQLSQVQRGVPFDAGNTCQKNLCQK
jgi:hypothetical protein